MELNEDKIKSLPENAYRELKPGEEYQPVLPPDKSFEIGRASCRERV